ncbi:Type I phosphodiesterase / nucleotide pyrophosphatase [Candidatus Methylomirabilis lanthanidiphila]|uniref:Type I phosphodiesterase / nucleotide pyrophosphatase n=1 Tax=Candidatus Methylomirabilis lanthanidiphila TaxID=2211376 RepID=A0A564ZM44_9BACT|nr:alkaline phosphatase family protein [Candidatus Methylomirabilis lanthanidiphila]VUZ86381.1 Type I phosphodiesterase / nucleotide pyrophosphatase [Candidatus Methylomirabilis lanthanidiphila]
MSGRCLLIGLDGATFSILDPLMEEGVMPFLKRFVESGTRAELRSVVPPLTPPAWTSIMTGRSPGNHGIVDFFTYESPDTRYVRFANSSHVQCETVWSMASRHRLTSTTLNFPLMAPPRPIAGHVVPGWVLWRYLRHYCYPAGLYDRLKGLPGFLAKELAMNIDLEQKAVEGCAQEEQEEWARFHIRRERQWFEILTWLMRTEPSHLTAIVFDGVDKLQHLFWRLLDPACRAERLSPRDEGLRRLCLDYFRQLDGIIAEAVTLAGEDANVFFVSDHGFGPSDNIFYVNSWLHQNGYLKWAGNGAPNEQAAGALGLNLGMIGSMDRLIDWSGTTAYARTPSSYGIHICVAGTRGEEGVPPADYLPFRQRLADALRAFTDPATGQPVVTRVWTREEAFSGPLADIAPDLTFALRNGGAPSTVPSDTALHRRAETIGSHRPEGIFLARGPAVANGASLPQISVLDATPILLYALGIPVPEDLEGRVPPGLFKPAFVTTHPIMMGGPTIPPETFPSVAVEGEGEQEVMARLKALGYVD